jgi:hypothetical protein
MKKLLLVLAAAAIFPTVSYAAPAFDPCLSAHEKVSDLRRAVAAQQPTVDAKINTATPSAEFENLWFKAQEPNARKWFDEHEAPKVRAIGGNVETAFALSFGQLKKDPPVRAVMIEQFRALLRDQQRSSSNAALASFQSDVNKSCPMDVASQSLRVAIGVIAAPVTIVTGNFEAAKNETGVLPQALRAVTGISLGDIERHGIFGGRNSFFRCPGGGC